MQTLYRYRNGNYIVNILEDGTKIRITNDSEWKPSFAENIDIKITDRCTGTNCAFCHEGSGPKGKQGDILNLKFWDTLHAGQEVALGGGNVLEHPDLLTLLYKLKSNNVVANITVNQIHFIKYHKLIEELIKNKLVYGIGVSLVTPSKTFISLISQEVYKNVVIHTINGILTKDDINKLVDKGFKLLILGYKHLRRGNDYFEKEKSKIEANQKWLADNILEIVNHFEVVSFDNLALEQLDIKNKVDSRTWEECYMGDDGEYTFYIDCVNQEYAMSSTTPLDKRHKLLDNVDEMFHNIIGERNGDQKNNYE